MESTLRTEYSLATVYLNTASHGVLPARTARALREAVDAMATGRTDQVAGFEKVEEARRAYGRVAGIDPGRVAVGSSVAAHAGTVARSLRPGAEVVCARDEFSSLVNPFHARGDLTVREVPLEKLAEAVGAGTALVAVSAVQSLDGRMADLRAVREAARDHGARVLVDSTQALGWLPLSAAGFDYTVCDTYKWLLGPRGVSFLTLPADGGDLVPAGPGWLSARDPWATCYGAVRDPAPDARRFDDSFALLPGIGTAASLALVEEVGTEAIAAHDEALARRFRAGVARLGYEPVAGRSPIVSVPGLGAATADALAERGVRVSARGGRLRASFHLYNTEADVDRLLEALPVAGRG
ncbi:aminotransferase class V-fold PLP-dependent enzyme [Streptomyces harbinensis]|uniref:aminotransferase class V-fold PLP-dependent enzyme n=1 Tax=Streptomyces harbinensis TaxID=1176198 RepID=UPI00158FE4BF|nr:aminotransferase class V-fold PLP-dependent enzyme [Streptomyces harbinensis]QKV71730.1 aminotransferase class V-fold PLP-dependent enzyme [Streptomyces harbinensis]